PPSRHHHPFPTRRSSDLAIAAHETQRFGLAEMDADIKDDARGAHALAVEEAQQVPWIVHVSEFLHEPLGVERPAFRVPRGAGRRSEEHTSELPSRFDLVC